MSISTILFLIACVAIFMIGRYIYSFYFAETDKEREERLEEERESQAWADEYVSNLKGLPQAMNNLMARQAQEAESRHPSQNVTFDHDRDREIRNLRRNIATSIETAAILQDRDPGLAGHYRGEAAKYESMLRQLGA